MAWIVGTHMKNENPYWLAMNGGVPNLENRNENLAIRFDRKDDAISFIRFIEGFQTHSCVSLLKYWILKEIMVPTVMSDVLHKCYSCGRNFDARSPNEFVGFHTGADELGNLHIRGNLCSKCHGNS